MDAKAKPSAHSADLHSNWNDAPTRTCCRKGSRSGIPAFFTRLRRKSCRIMLLYQFGSDKVMNISERWSFCDCYIENAAFPVSWLMPAAILMIAKSRFLSQIRFSCYFEKSGGEFWCFCNYSPCHQWTSWRDIRVIKNAGKSMVFEEAREKCRKWGTQILNYRAFEIDYPYYAGFYQTL